MADPDFKPPSSTSQADDKVNKPEQTGVEVERGVAVNPQSFYRNAAKAGLDVIAGPLVGQAVRSASELFSQTNKMLTEASQRREAFREYDEVLSRGDVAEMERVLREATPPKGNPQQPTPGHDAQPARHDNAELGGLTPPATPSSSQSTRPRTR